MSLEFSPFNDRAGSSVVERVFPNPDSVTEGEYYAILDFMMSPDIRDEPEMIVGSLNEFISWSQYLLEEMKKAGYAVD